MRSGDGEKQGEVELKNMQQHWNDQRNSNHVPPLTKNS